jgi:hypothetical protein
VTDHTKELADALRNSRDALHGFLALTLGKQQASETKIIKQIDEALQDYDAAPRGDVGPLDPLADNLEAIADGRPEQFDLVPWSPDVSTADRLRLVAKELRTISRAPQPVPIFCCARCGQPFSPVTHPGALLWSPPDEDMWCKKHHICAPCYTAAAKHE